MGDTIEMNAKFTNGHVKVMTRSYAENMSLVPNDLALLDVEELIADLNEKYSNINWSPRIQFGGLVDAPDEQGETKSQGPAMGLGLDLLSNSKEVERLNIFRSLVRGNLIHNQGEALISENLSQKLKVSPGDRITLIGSTMHGGMAMHNFTVAGTISFGNEIMDRGAIIVDIEDARLALDMPNAAGELLGFFTQGFYNNDLAQQKAEEFNKVNFNENDEFAPVMMALSQQGGMGQYVALAEVWSVYLSAVFVFAMALVLWNAGLLGALRRYGEVGIRLAMGEEKGHVYRTMIYESICIGIAGTVIGTAFGLFFAWLIQTYGIDISGMMEGASMMMPTHIRARITPTDFYIGFIPGLVSTLIGDRKSVV